MNQACMIHTTLRSIVHPTAHRVNIYLHTYVKPVGPTMQISQAQPINQRGIPIQMFQQGLRPPYSCRCKRLRYFSHRLMLIPTYE
jgi:hypothetical protein